MNPKAIEIIEKYESFSTYLKSIDMKVLLDHLTLEDMTELKDKLDGISLRYLNTELRQAIFELKVEKDPDFQNHSYPVSEADFLTEPEQKQFNDFLLILRKGESIAGLNRLTKGNVKKQFKIEQFLVEKGIADEFHFVLCPSCGRGHISNSMDNSQKKELESILKRKVAPEERHDLLMELLPYICMECDEQPEYETIQEVTFKTYLIKK